MEKIREENRWVVAQGDRPFVSVAYVVPLPEAPDDVSEVFRHELQGAHLAQRRANRTSELGDQPLVRLLVANAGGGNEHWEPVVDQLLARVDSPDRLVAVAGLGASRETTRQTITALTARNIPVIGSRLTADDLSGEPGFARVGFTNHDQVQAAVAYLKRDFAFRRALLVQDINPDDLFSEKLAEAFAEEFPDVTHTLIEPSEVYDSSLGGVGNRLVQALSSICLQRPDVVLFAGGRPALEDFVEALLGRPCADFHINLVTGDSPSARMDTPALQAGLGSRVTLRYTELTHPGAWATAPEAFSPASVRYFRQGCAGEHCFASLFRTESTDERRRSPRPRRRRHRSTRDPAGRRPGEPLRRPADIRRSAPTAEQLPCSMRCLARAAGSPSTMRATPSARPSRSLRSGRTAASSSSNSPRQTGSPAG